MPNYIGKKEALAIKDWVNPDTTEMERTVLHDSIIQPAFRKLVDNLIYIYGQTTSEFAKEWREECISHLLNRIKKYDPERCKNPFSFFNVCAKHFIIHQINDRKKYTRLVTIYRKDVNENSGGADENTMNSAINNDHFIDSSYVTAAEDIENDFLLFLQAEIARYLVNCQDKKEKVFLKHVIQILESNKSIDISNKKQFYIMMRSMSNFNGREITKYLARLKKQYESIKYHYHNELI